jgi:hypothetical protein
VISLQISAERLAETRKTCEIFGLQFKKAGSLWAAVMRSVLLSAFLLQEAAKGKTLDD